jgi:hypothetical protein
LDAVRDAFVEQAPPRLERSGIKHHARLDEVDAIHNYRISREHFMNSVRRDYIEITGDDGVREVLGLSR